MRASLPLLGDGRLLGALNLYGTSAGCFDVDAQRIAQVVARQAAMAIRYLELFQAERRGRSAEQRIAHELQRSLLPAVPELLGLACAARYLVAADTARVGGDWYDVFALPDGAVGLAVGDVMGHDVVAAAAMGQLRSVLRSYAWEGGSPSGVLDRLDRLVQGFDMAQLATTLYGRLVLDRYGGCSCTATPATSPRRALSQAAADDSLDELCDRLLENAAGDGQDDVALLVLRIT